jgi:hypothetical protein
VRAIVQSSGEDTVGRQGILIDVNHDLEALAAVAGAYVASQVAFRQGNHAIGTGRLGWID